MNISKKSLFLFFIMISALSGRAATSDTNELNQQMKSFQGRVRVYLKCVRGTCSPEERTAAANTVLRDGRNILLAVGALASGVWIVKHGLSFLEKKIAKSDRDTSLIANASYVPLIEKEEIEDKLNSDTNILSYFLMLKRTGAVRFAEKKGTQKGYKAHWNIKADEYNFIDITVYYAAHKQANTFVKAMESLITKKNLSNFIHKNTITHVP